TSPSGWGARCRTRCGPWRRRTRVGALLCVPYSRRSFSGEPCMRTRTMPEDHPLIALTELLLRAAAHRQRYAREDKVALLQEVLARARGPQAHLQDWWRQHTGVRDLATVAFPPRPTAALAAPQVRIAREAVGQHLRAQLATTDSGETILH